MLTRICRSDGEGMPSRAGSTLTHTTEASPLPDGPPFRVVNTRRLLTTLGRLRSMRHYGFHLPESTAVHDAAVVVERPPRLIILKVIVRAELVGGCQAGHQAGLLAVDQRVGSRVPRSPPPLDEAEEIGEQEFSVFQSTQETALLVGG